MLTLNDITIDGVIDAYAKAGYPLYTRGIYNLNIFGIRTDDDESNKFNDFVGIVYKSSNTRFDLFVAEATTDPGVYYRNNPMNVEGTAILQPGHHKGAYRLGKHRGQYDALVQNAKLPLWRDNDGDGTLDLEGETHNDLAGINIHRATGNKGGTSTQVDKWSAGCQVIASYDKFEEFMKIVKKSQEWYTGPMSYTLFTEAEYNK